MRPQTFNSQNDELFISVIDWFHRYFKLSQEERFQYLQQNNITVEPSLELFLTPHCNQDCSYCYLQANKESLYPSEFTDNELILKNLRILLDYYLSEHMDIPKLDLYSGEILGYPFCNKVFDIILEYIGRGLKIQTISIPSNGSFCFSTELIKIVESYITQFKKHNVVVSISISWDGPIIDSLQRPIKNNQIQKNNDEFIENLCNFMVRNYCGFHPMIDPDNIELQIDNYREWIKLLDKYFPEGHPLIQHGRVMQLEVRSPRWTEDKIISYLKWLKFYIDTDLEHYFHNDLKVFENLMCKNVKKEDYLKEIGFTNMHYWTPYLPYQINQSETPIKVMGCTLGRSLVIRLGDFAIIPCHRTGYTKFILGYYTVKNDKIIGLSCTNYPLTSAVYLTSFARKPKCDTCALNTVCIKGCLGANYEANRDLFYPEPHNCEMQKAKMIFLYQYYTKLNIVPKNLESIYQLLLENEQETVLKWNTIIQSLI